MQEQEASSNAQKVSPSKPARTASEQEAGVAERKLNKHKQTNKQKGRVVLSVKLFLNSLSRDIIIKSGFIL